MLIRTITFSAMLLALGVAVSGCSLGETSAPTPTPNPTPSMDNDGGLRLILGAEPVDDSGSVTQAQMEEARDVVKKRLETMELPYASVTVSGEGELTVDVPGASDAEDVKEFLVRRGFIEFVDGGNESLPAQSFVTTELGGPRVTELPADPQAKVYPVVLTGSDFVPEVASVYSQSGSLVVELNTTEEGRKKLADYTSANIGSYMGVVLDKRVLTSPLIMSEITGGTTAISGIADQEARQILLYVKSGALPVYLSVESEEVVEPQS